MSRKRSGASPLASLAKVVVRSRSGSLGAIAGSSRERMISIRRSRGASSAKYCSDTTSWITGERVSTWGNMRSRSPRTASEVQTKVACGALSRSASMCERRWKRVDGIVCGRKIGIAS